MSLVVFERTCSSRSAIRTIVPRSPDDPLLVDQGLSQLDEPAVVSVRTEEIPENPGSGLPSTVVLLTVEVWAQSASGSTSLTADQKTWPQRSPPCQRHQPKTYLLSSDDKFPSLAGGRFRRSPRAALTSAQRTPACVLVTPQGAPEDSRWFRAAGPVKLLF